MKTISGRDLSPELFKKIYQLFKIEYLASTGHFFTEEIFKSKVRNWYLIGDFDGDNVTGFLSYRKQNSGLIKLTGLAGRKRIILLSIKELNSGNVPIWAAVDLDIKNLLAKVGFISPPKYISKIIYKMLVAGGQVEDGKLNSDGSFSYNVSGIGERNKFFTANKKYYLHLLPMIKERVSGLTYKIIQAFVSSI